MGRQALRAIARASLSAVFEELVDSQADISSNAAKQDGRQVTASMNRDGGRAAVRMTEPLMRTALSYFRKAGRDKNGDDLARLEDGYEHHAISGHDDGLRADVFARHLGQPVVEDHGDDFLEVVVEFVARLPLAVRTRKTGDIADIEARIRATLHDGGVAVHGLGYPSLVVCVNPTDSIFHGKKQHCLATVKHFRSLALVVQTAL